MFDANLCFSMSHHDINDYQVDNHTHDCYEIVYYIRGTGVSKIQDVEYTYSDHTFCIIPPNMTHAEWTTSEVDLMYIGFNYDDNLGVLPSGLLKDDDEGTIYNLLIRIQQELRDQKLHYDLQLSLLQRELVVNLLRRVDGDSIVSKSSRESMGYVMNFINSNFATPISLENLAESVGYSYHHFRHIFKDSYGISPKQYILNVRMNHAKLLLQQKKLSVRQVSQMCGFKSDSQFVAAFRKHTGLSPLSYKHATDNFEERAQYENKSDESL